MIGVVDTPAAVLIRPDGYVAWTGALTDPELPSALSRWLGQELGDGGKRGMLSR